MKPVLLLSDQIYTVSGQRRDSAVSGEGIALVHTVTRRHLHIEILWGISFQGLEQPEIIGKDDETVTPFPERSD